MPTKKRYSTKYPGVYFIESIGASGKPDSIYYVRYRRNGKMIEEKAGRQSQGMTPARANKLRTQRIDGKEETNAEKRAADQAAKEAEASEKDRLTITKLWNQYCGSNPDNKALSHDKRKFDLHLRDSIGDKEPSQLLALDVDRIRLGLQKQGKRTQAARVLEILRRTINYGVKRGLIAPLPFKIGVPRLNNQITEDLSKAQLKQLVEVLNADEDQTAANVMRLALYTGMRRSEILKITWADLDFEKRFITLQNPKGGRDQTIPMNAMAERIFKGTKAKGSNPYVFPGRKKGTHLTECRKSFDRIKKAANLPESFRTLQGLRHVYASMLASSGQVDLYTLQRLLTHKSPIMTQRYAHLRDEALKKASNLAGDLIDTALNEKKERAK